MEEAINKILKERGERLNYIFETYGKIPTLEEMQERIENNKSINPNLEKHQEAVNLIGEVYGFYLDGKMTRTRAKELTANIIEKCVNPSLRLAQNDEIRYSFQSTENVKKPYGTTDGYINVMRSELRSNGLEIYTSNDG